MIWSPGIDRSMTNTMTATPSNVSAASRRRRAKPLRSTPGQLDRGRPQVLQRAVGHRDEPGDVRRRGGVGVAGEHPDPRRVVLQLVGDLGVDLRLRSAGSLVALPSANSWSSLSEQYPATLFRLPVAGEVAAVHAVRVGAAAVERHRGVEVAGDPAVDVRAGLQDLEVQVDVGVGELGLQVLRLVDRGGVLALGDDGVDGDAVRLAGAGELLGGLGRRRGSGTAARSGRTCTPAT